MYRSILKITIWKPETRRNSLFTAQHRRDAVVFLMPFNPITSSGFQRRARASVPEGWTGFLDIFGVDNIGQVRIMITMAIMKYTWCQGEGTIDFDALFKRLNTLGYKGWFSLGFGNAADKIRVKMSLKKIIRRKTLSLITVIGRGHSGTRLIRTRSMPAVCTWAD